MFKKDSDYLFSMIWGVDRGGYDLADDLIIPTRKKWQTYNPFKDHSGLARKFSQIPIRSGRVKGEEVLKFANQYGLLGIDGSYGMEGESLQEWAEMIGAVRYILKQINKGDQEEALYAFNGRSAVPPMKLSIYNQGKPNERSLKMAPTTLAGAIWLMTANEIVSGPQFQPCNAPDCGEFFPIRPNKRYCSEVCKQSAYRERHR